MDDMRAALEVKSSHRILATHLKGLREAAVEHPSLEKRFVVCLEDRPRTTDDGIEILPAEEFVRRLWEGRLV